MKLRQIAVMGAAAAMLAVAGVNAAEKGPAPERIIDNETFRLMKITWMPGEKQAELHQPPTKLGSVLVALTAGEIEANFRQNGKTWTEKGHVDIGKVWYLPMGLEHQFANIGTTPFQFTSTQIK
jgi:hypothetical protein